MKSKLLYLPLVLFTLLVLPSMAIAQAEVEVSEAKGYFMERVIEPLSISTRQLDKANTLQDLNANYKPEWVKEYRSVEVVTLNGGTSLKSVSDNDVLSQEQKDNMSAADEGSAISIKVTYLPENNLVQNDVKEFEFTFQVNPENYAKYDGENYSNYLEETKIQDVVESAFGKGTMVVVKFNINEAGDVEDVFLFESSRDEQTDNLLLEIVREMPPWQPASYASGRNVKQEMVLSAGNLESCVKNFLNLPKE